MSIRRAEDCPGRIPPEFVPLSDHRLLLQIHLY